MTMLRTVSFAAGVLVTLTLTAPTADAKYGSVRVCSRFDTQCISAPTRAGRQGLEVRLPSGTWISCRQDCHTTLRDETIDFWAKRDWERPGEGRRRD